MKLKKLSLVLTTSLVISLSLFGCGRQGADTVSGGKKPVVIKATFWGAPDELNIITNIIKKWQKSHPDIIVKLEHTPYRGYIDKLLTRIAGRSAPDIICTEVDLFVTFQSKDVLLDLTPYVNADPALNTDDFYPEIIDRFSVKGKLYAIPRDTAPFACVYYNKKLFDEEGIPYPTDDWDVYDMLDKAKKLTKTSPDGRTLRYGFYAWAWQNFIYSFGGKLVDKVKNPKKCMLNSKRSIEGLKFYSDLINKYKVHPTTTAMANLAMGVQGMFMTERLAMFSSGIWETPGLRRIDNFEWDVVMFPKGPTGIRGFGTGGTGYCILKSTKHPKEAFEVLKALAGQKAQAMLAETGLTQPAIKSIAETWANDAKIPKNKKMLIEAMQHVIYDPFTPVWREARELYIIPALDRVFNGKVEVEPVMDGVVSNVNALLREGR
ncbi:MAG: sugar ABC transporter substrate-binding protein [Candidatus Omnitrophota bacterium]|nr:MAG: sugar ABC transporter substrate-binding protein [Candidatus Omnitrophota bacterium]